MKEEQRRDLVKPWKPGEHDSEYHEREENEANMQPYDTSRAIKVYVDQEKEEKTHQQDSGVPPEVG